MIEKNQQLKKIKPVPRQHLISVSPAKLNNNKRSKSLPLPSCLHPVFAVTIKKLESMPLIAPMPRRFQVKQPYLYRIIDNSYLHQFLNKSNHNNSCRSFRKRELSFVPKKKTDGKIDLNIGIKNIIQQLKGAFKKFEKLIRQMQTKLSLSNNVLKLFYSTIQEMNKKIYRIQTQYSELRPVLLSSERNMQKMMASIFQHNQATSQIHYLHPNSSTTNEFAIKPKKQSLYDNQISVIPITKQQVITKKSERCRIVDPNQAMQVSIESDGLLSQLIKQASTNEQNLVANQNALTHNDIQYKKIGNQQQNQQQTMMVPPKLI